jgi:hypothetical protein
MSTAYPLRERHIAALAGEDPRVDVREEDRSDR